MGKATTSDYIVVNSAAHGTSDSFGTSKVESALPPTTLEERITALEYELANQKKAFNEAQKQTTQTVTELKTTIHMERQARVQADRQIQKLLEEFSTGGLHLEGLGLMWLLGGITMSSIPCELAVLLTYLGL